MQGAVVSPAALKPRKPRNRPEAAFQAQVVALARANGWMVAYLPDWLYRLALADMRRRRRGDRDWPDRGFPDLVLGRGNVALFCELKSDVGSLSREQRAWRQMLEEAGLQYRYWRPRNWTEIEKELSA